MTTLLEKAKKIKLKARTTYGKEEFDLAIAWFNDEVGATQVIKTLGWESGGSVYTFLAGTLKAGVKNGYLEIKLKEKNAKKKNSSI